MSSEGAFSVQCLQMHSVYNVHHQRRATCCYNPIPTATSANPCASTTTDPSTRASSPAVLSRPLTAHPSLIIRGHGSGVRGFGAPNPMREGFGVSGLRSPGHPPRGQRTVTLRDYPPPPSRTPACPIGKSPRQSAMNRPPQSTLGCGVMMQTRKDMESK